MSIVKVRDCKKLQLLAGIQQFDRATCPAVTWMPDAKRALGHTCTHCVPTGALHPPQACVGPCGAMRYDGGHVMPECFYRASRVMIGNTCQLGNWIPANSCSFLQSRTLTILIKSYPCQRQGELKDERPAFGERRISHQVGLIEFARWHVGQVRAID